MNWTYNWTLTYVENERNLYLVYDVLGCLKGIVGHVIGNFTRYYYIPQHQMILLQSVGLYFRLQEPSYENFQVQDSLRIFWFLLCKGKRKVSFCNSTWAWLIGFILKQTKRGIGKNNQIRSLCWRDRYGTDHCR